MSGSDVDDCNVFVKYLPPEFSDEELYDLFAPFGKIISAKVMIDHQSGNSLGYGFVRYHSSESALASIEALSGTKIKNKTLLCKLSNSTPNSSAYLQPHTNLYIKPLLENTTEEHLRAVFEKFGEIIECKVMVDKNTGTSRQIGFVRFSSLEEATEAMNEMNGKKLCEDAPPLVVRYAETHLQKTFRKYRNIQKQNQSEFVMVPGPPIVPPFVLDPMGYQQILPPPVGVQYIPIPTSAPTVPILPAIPAISVPQVLQLSPRHMHEYPYTFPPPFSIPEEPNLFVFHLPPEIDDDGLARLFEPFGPLESVKVITDKTTGESKGYGFVKFVSHNDADRALNVMNGHCIGSKRLSVSYKTPPSPRGQSVSPLSSPRSGAPTMPGSGQFSPRHMSPLPIPTSPIPLSPRTYHRMVSPRFNDKSQDGGVPINAA